MELWWKPAPLCCRLHGKYPTQSARTVNVSSEVPVLRLYPDLLYEVQEFHLFLKLYQFRNHILLSAKKPVHLPARYFHLQSSVELHLEKFPGLRFHLCTLLFLYFPAHIHFHLKVYSHQMHSYPQKCKRFRCLPVRRLLPEQMYLPADKLPQRQMYLPG